MMIACELSTVLAAQQPVHRPRPLAPSIPYITVWYYP